MWRNLQFYAKSILLRNIWKIFKIDRHSGTQICWSFVYQTALFEKKMGTLLFMCGSKLALPNRFILDLMVLQLTFSLYCLSINHRQGRRNWGEGGRKGHLPTQILYQLYYKQNLHILDSFVSFISYCRLLVFGSFVTQVA